MFWRNLKDILKTSLQDVLKTSSKRLQDALKISWRFCKTSSRVLKKVLKSNHQDDYIHVDVFARRLEEKSFVLKTNHQDEYIYVDHYILKTWLRQIYSSWSRGLEGEDERCLQDVFRNSSSRRMFTRLSPTFC